MKQDCDVVTNLWISLKQRLKENIWLDFYWDYIFFIQTESKLFVLEDKHIVITLILDHVFSCLEYVSCLSCLLFVSKLWFDLMSAADWCDDEQIDLSSTNFFNSFTWFCVVGGLCGVEVTCCEANCPPGIIKFISTLTLFYNNRMMSVSDHVWENLPDEYRCERIRNLSSCFVLYSDCVDAVCQKPSVVIWLRLWRPTPPTWHIWTWVKTTWGLCIWSSSVFS